MKIKYGLMSVYDAKLLTRNKVTIAITDIKQGDLLTFNRLKDTNAYIKDNLCHALKPVKVIEETFERSDSGFSEDRTKRFYRLANN